ncbi:kinase-like protein [Mollisia scopiformis]|uniref:Kinase-like protein n=1 Tax=Mollisia scopiformis TaxID=149040 RepID=A0A132B7P9_MOLSC|nr:kinase-like protein [Mollisia scopiformis]KUJ07914.1 kinase-like protein [Mollisia scopiformis]
MALNHEEKDEISTNILHDLSQTAYACSSLIPISGGTANFVFRGIHRDGTIIIKHSTNFASCNRDFPLDISRCIFEESMLNYLQDLPISLVKTPRLLLFDQVAYTQVHEDFSDSIDLKAVIFSGSLSHSVAKFIGYNLGTWTRSFHTWASTRTLYAEQNEPMRKLKYLITYGSFIEVLERFPEVLGTHKATLEEIEARSTKELQTLADDGLQDWGVIHGDFWSGNVLVSQSHKNNEPGLFIVDWELAHFGHRSYDLGQMIGDLYERKYFRDAEPAMWIIQALIDGYGPIDDDMAFRIAIHTGVHLICWCIRGPAKDTPERMSGIIRIGMNFMLKAWEKDKEWFQDTILASLFN